MTGERPLHIFIIPDGNRRWARNRLLHYSRGHEEGAKTFQNILDASLQEGIPYVTCWALSLSNVLSRSKEELRFLFSILEDFFLKLVTSREIRDHGVRVRVLGRWERYCPPLLQTVIKECVAQTSRYRNFHLTILLCYSGFDEMEDSIYRMVRYFREHSGAWEILRKGFIKNFLWTRELPPVDLVIRTGGEPHWSDGALMWDIGESRFYFTETLWPDFSVGEFRSAVAWYEKLEKRRGA